MNPLTTTRFEQAMHDIAEHHRRPPRAREPKRQTPALPPEVLGAARRPSSRSGNDPLGDWKQRMKSDSTGFSQTHQAGVTAAARQYQQDRDDRGFTRRIDTQADQGEQTAHQNISDWKALGVALGHQHPDWQQDILQAFHEALNFFTQKVVDDITAFLMNAVATLLEWIATAFEVIGPYFADLLADIAVFFLAL